MTPWRFEGAPDPNRENFGWFGGRPGLFGGCCRGGGRRSRGGAAGGRGRGGGGGCGRLRLRGRINPAGVNAATQRLRDLGVDLPAKPGQATKRRLDMTSGAAETVVEVEMPEGGIEVVKPHQTHHATAKPDAFRVSGRAVNDLRRLVEFVGLALIILGQVGRRGRIT